jgi:hypothetical protein
VYSLLLGLAALLSTLTSPVCVTRTGHVAAESGPLPKAPSQVRVAGELRFYRHIDPMTGRGAVALVASSQEMPLDFRRFELDILLRPGPYTVVGSWEAGRLVVTEAYPGPGR